MPARAQRSTADVARELASGDTQKRETAARTLYLEVEWVGHLTDQPLREQLPRLYRDVYPLLLDPRYAPVTRVTRPVDVSTLTPDAAAQVYLSRDGWTGLLYEARRRCDAVLTANRDRVRPLLVADLASGSPSAKVRGLDAVAALRIPDLTDDVLRLARDPAPVSDHAASTLRELNEARGIAALLAADPDHPSRFNEVIRSLQRNRPPDAALERLLLAPIPADRARAALVLSDSGHPSLIPVVQRLALDEAAEVREACVSLAGGLRGSLFQSVRPSLVPLLADSSKPVRLAAAALLAYRKDAACAPALLDLARDEKLDVVERGKVIQAVRDLAGQDFGLRNSTDLFPSSGRTDRAAVRRFAEWVKEHDTRR